MYVGCPAVGCPAVSTALSAFRAVRVSKLEQLLGDRRLTLYTDKVAEPKKGLEEEIEAKKKEGLETTGLEPTIAEEKRPDLITWSKFPSGSESKQLTMIARFAPNSKRYYCDGDEPGESQSGHSQRRAALENTTVLTQPIEIHPTPVFHLYHTCTLLPRFHLALTLQSVSH